MPGVHDIAPLAFVPAGRAGVTDALLCQFVEQLSERGVRVCGSVQRNPVRAGEDRCDMVVTAHPSGREFKISEDRGPGAKGCRLDAGALELAVADVEAALGRGADILVINKFGKHEAEGRGFCNVLGHALAAGMPALIAVNAPHREAFLTFSDGYAVEVAPDLDALMGWAAHLVPAGSGE